MLETLAEYGQHSRGKGEQKLAEAVARNAGLRERVAPISLLWLSVPHEAAEAVAGICRINIHSILGLTANAFRHGNIFSHSQVRHAHRLAPGLNHA